MTVATRFNAFRDNFATFRQGLLTKLHIKRGVAAPPVAAAPVAAPPADVGDFAPKGPKVSLTKSVTRPPTKVELWMAAHAARLAPKPPPASYMHLPLQTLRHLVYQGLGREGREDLATYGSLPANFPAERLHVLEAKVGGRAVGTGETFTLSSHDAPVVTGINPDNSPVRALNEASIWKTPVASGDVELTRLSGVKVGYHNKDGGWTEQVLPEMILPTAHKLATFDGFNPPVA